MALVETELLKLPQPFYTCPMCRGVIREKPMQVLVLRDLIEVVENAVGEEQEPTIHRPLWDKYFISFQAGQH